MARGHAAGRSTDAGAWAAIRALQAGASSRFGELQYAERTTSITNQANTTYVDSGLALPAFTVGSRPVMVELFWPNVLNGTAGGVCRSAVTHDAGSTAAANTVLAESEFASASAFAGSMLRVAVRLVTPGTYVLKARHLVTSGAGKFGLVTAGQAAYLRAEEV